jgi:hypothetical protein
MLCPTFGKKLYNWIDLFNWCTTCNSTSFACKPEIQSSLSKKSRQDTFSHI